MDNWLNNLKSLWLNKDVDSIINLFKDNVIYYETPFEKISNIKEVWNDILDQDIKHLDYTILGTSENKIIANFILELNNNCICDMVYEIELDSNNKCIYFKQWYMNNK